MSMSSISLLSREDCLRFGQQGKVAFDAGIYDEAREQFTRALEGMPDQPAFLSHRGECHRQLGNIADALIDLNRALELQPDYLWARSRRGECHLQKMDYEAAVVDFSAVLDQEPDHLWALAHRGATYRYMYRPDEALVDLNQALYLKPDYAWAMMHRATALCMKRCYLATLADIERALSIDPNIFPHWEGECGLVLNAMGRYDDSIALCAEGLARAPGDIFALYSQVVAKCKRDGLQLSGKDIQSLRTVLHTRVDTSEHIDAVYRLSGLAAMEGDYAAALDLLRDIIHLGSEPRGLVDHDRAFDDLWKQPVWKARLEELKNT